MKNLENIKKIIVHPGQAHRDDWLLASLICYKCNKIISIKRRDPTKEELEDPEIFVGDVGEKLEPEKMNFDHHQNKNLSCALSLFLEWFNPEWWEYERVLDQYSKRSWLLDLSYIDTHGIKKAKEIGCISQSIFESEMVNLFANTPNGISIKAGMKFWEQREKKFKQSKELKKFVKNNPLKKIEFFDLTAVIIPDSSFEIWQLIKEYEKEFKIEYYPAIIIFPDDRGDGWGVLRRNDCPGVNFSKLESNESVLFAHKNGFIFKTKEKINLEKLREIINLIFI